MTKVICLLGVLTIFFGLNTILCSECGVTKFSDGFIINGESAKRGQWPWIAALFDTNRQKFFCAATLISQGHVVTAAHCIQPKFTTKAMSKDDMVVLLGRYNLDVIVERGSLTSTVGKVNIHPEWRANVDSFDADIAVLALQSRVAFTDFIKPICWPSRKIENFEGTIVGWGKSESNSIHENTPRQANVTAVPNETCFLSNGDFVKISSTRTFCAHADNSGPCNGDSGGGLFVHSHAGWLIRGIISSSVVIAGSCDVSKHAIYTNVFAFSDWVQERLAEDSFTDDKTPSAGQVSSSRPEEVEIQCTYQPFEFEHASPRKSRCQMILEMR